MREHIHGFTLIEIMIVIACIGIILAMFMGFLVSQDTAIHAAQTQGYSEPIVTNDMRIAVRLRGCGGDAAGFEMDATNPRGERVKILVCCGLLKNCTIRSQ
ncbi:MAG: type II secretion system protein [Candidatus Uhrbacteria bacterium]